MEIDTQTFLASTERDLKEYFDLKLDAHLELYQQQADKIKQLSAQIAVLDSHISDLREYRSNLTGKLAVIAVIMSMGISIGIMLFNHFLK
jgi:hypothetical protein